MKVRNACSSLVFTVICLSVLLALSAAVLALALREPAAREPVSLPVSSGTEPVSATDAAQSRSAVRSVEIVSSSDYIAVGFSIPFAAETVFEQPAQDAGDKAGLVWQSSDEAVATVDAGGVVTGVSVGRALITARTAGGECRDTSVVRVAESGLVFLSPSRQTWNHYAVGDTDECTEAFNIAYLVEKKLLAAGCEVYVCPIGPDLNYRATIAKDMDALCYVAIHTNAGADNYFGTTALFHPDIKSSLLLSLSLFNEVGALTPTREAHGLSNGMQKGGVGYAEIREPGKKGIPSTLLEIEYHDKAEQAQWILDNEEEIAEAISVGILKYLSTVR